MTRQRTLLLVLLGCVLMAAGCQEQEFNLITVPPPSRTGKLDGHALQLSQGVALAIECIDPEDDLRTCGTLRVRSQDPGRARAFVAEVDQLFAARVRGRATSRSERRSIFVVTGVAAGETRVEVETRRGTESFAVTVSP